jgi:hypothetical protein
MKKEPPMNRLLCAIGFSFILAAFPLLLAVTAEANPETEIRTLLQKDGIPSIDDPKFASVKEADGYMGPNEMVIGVDINEDRRAYSVPQLSSHEIVNDVIGGRKVAVTW